MSISYAMRKWAVNNARLAQGLIAISTILLFFLGHILGVLADLLGWDTYAMFLIGTGMAILAWTLAPRKAEDFPIRYTYARQKAAVVIMLTSMTMAIGGWAVCLERFDVQPIAFVDQQSEAAIGSSFTRKASTLQVDRIISDWFYGGVSKRMMNRMRRFTTNMFRKDVSEASRALICFGLLLIAIAISLFSLLLGCSLSCNGLQALGVLVSVGGLSLAILTLKWAFNILYPERRKIKKAKIRKPNPDT